MKSTSKIILTLIVSIFFLSGCEVYTTLYGSSSDDTEIVYVPDTAMVVTGEVVSEEPQEENKKKYHLKNLQKLK